LITCISIIILQLKNKKWKSLLFFIAFFGAYLLIVNVSYPDQTTPTAYIEGLYVPLAYILGLHVVFELLPAIKSYKLVVFFFIAVLCSWCLRVYLVKPVYSARLSWERNFLLHCGDKKIIIDAKKINAGILQMLWGSPYELCLLSSLENGKTASIIIDDKPLDREFATAVRKSFIVNWNVYDYDKLPLQYFNFTDTVNGYLVDPELLSVWH
jgi:hypothetical protein